MSMKTKVIGRMPTDHGPYDPQLAYGKKFTVTLFDCGWESKHDNNITAPATLNEPAGTITPNIEHWIHRWGSYNQWLIDNGYKKVPASNIEDLALEKPQDEINAALVGEIGADSAPGTVKGRIKTLENAVGSGGSVDSRIAAAKAEIKGNATSACDTLGEAEALISANATAISGEAARAQTAEEQLRILYNNLQQSQPIPVTSLPATGEAGKIYRLAGTMSYADYMYAEEALTTPIKMAEYDNAVDDVPTAGSENIVKSGGVFDRIGLLYSNSDTVPAANYPNINYYFSGPLKGGLGKKLYITWSQDSGDFINRNATVILMNGNNVAHELGTLKNGEGKFFDTNVSENYNNLRLVFYGGATTESNNIDVKIGCAIEGDILCLYNELNYNIENIKKVSDNLSKILEQVNYNSLAITAANYPQYNFSDLGIDVTNKLVSLEWNQESGDLINEIATVVLMSGSTVVADIGKIKQGEPLFFDTSGYEFTHIRIYWVKATSYVNYINVNIEIGEIVKIEDKINKLRLENKSIAVFGDSISTYTDWCIGNNSWYGPEGEESAEGLNNVTSVKQTYWWKLSEALKAAITLNDSWSGSCVSYSGWGFNTNKEHSFVDRIQHGLFGKSRLLNGYNIAPDIIILNGGVNDSRPDNPYVGDYKYSDWVDEDFAYFRPAYAYIIDQLKYWNPNALILCVSIVELEKLSILESIETIAAHYQVPYIEVTLGNGGQGNGHPSINGHLAIYNAILNRILEELL